MRVVDYIFYRAYGWYGKERNGTPITSACILVAVLFCFTSLTLYMYADIYFHFDDHEYEDAFKAVLLALYFFVLLILWLRYRKKERLDSILVAYKDETRVLRVVRISLFWLYVVGIFAAFFKLVDLKHSV